MSSSTPHLDLLSSSQSQKELTANNLFDASSPALLFGRRASATHGLTFGLYGGVEADATGEPQQIANQTVTLTASATNYILSTGGVVSVVTSAPASWPGPLAGGAKALYTVVAGASTVSSYTDWRIQGAPSTTAPAVVNKRIAVPAYAGALTLNWDDYDIYRLTLTGDTSLTFSGGSDGQVCQLEITQDATGSRIVTFPAAVRYSTDIPAPTLTTTASKTDKLGFQRNSGLGKYDLMSIVKGF